MYLLFFRDDPDLEEEWSQDSSLAELEPYESTEESDSEVEEVIHVGDFDTNWRCLSVSNVEADPVCQRLDRLIREGLIPRDKILYKFLNDMTHIFYDKFHPYSEDVVEFLTSILYLGGPSTFNMFRGPMGIGMSQESECTTRMNFGGPCMETLRKRKPAFTTSPGVLKYLSSLHYKLSASDQFESGEPMIDNKVVVVYPVAFSNDGTALKPSVQFDERRNVNVSQKNDVPLRFCQSNPFMDRKILKEQIVTEAIVTSIMALDSTLSLPVAVEYSSKGGEYGERNVFKAAFYPPDV